MFELGPNLREARRRLGLELAVPAQDLFIRSTYLRALEDERFDLLPEGPYTRGFLGAYAEYLGLDRRLFVEEYDARVAAGGAQASRSLPRRTRRFRR